MKSVGPIGPIPDHILRLMTKEDRPRGVLTFAEIEEKRQVRLEKELQEQVASLLRQRNIVFNCSRMDRRKTDKVGWPDFTFAVAGRACAVECKMPGENLRPEQSVVINAMMGNGWLVAVVTDLSGLLDFLKTL